MDSAKLHSLIRQANFVGESKGVYVNYKRAGGQFVFKFFRHSKPHDTYLGSTQLPDKVIEKMQKFCTAE